MHAIIRFALPVCEERQDVEDDIALAIFTAECLYGRPQTRLEIQYLFSPDGSRCVVKVRGPAGEAAVRVFVGLLTVRCGGSGFSIEHVQDAGGV